LQLQKFHENSPCFKSLFICLKHSRKTCGQVIFFLQKSFFLIKCSPKGAITIKWGNGDEGLKDCNPFSGHFHFYRKKVVWDEFFCDILLKIHMIFSTLHNFCIKFSWITKNFEKCTNLTKFCVSFWKIILISNCMKIC